MNRIVEIAGRKWLLGLVWSNYERFPIPKDELQFDAARLNADLYAQRLGENAIQAGFCEPIEGINNTSKLYSLAAMLADSEEQPWLGIFQIADGLWWYIAVRDRHAILPDGDMVGTEQEILAARERHQGLSDWNYIEGDLETLDNMIRSIKAKPSPVKSLTKANLPSASLVVSIVVVITALIAAYVGWQYHLNLEEKQRRLEIAEMKAQLAANKPVITVPSPLLTSPSPNKWLAACAQIILTKPAVFSSWALDQVTCNASSASFRWIRILGGTVANKPVGSVSLDGNLIEQSEQYQGLELIGNDNSIDLAEAQLMLRAWAQRANITLTLMPVAIAPVLPGSEKKDVPPPKPQVNFSLDMKVAPFTFDFDVIPGLRLTKIQSRQGGWLVEGSIYGT